VIASPEYNGSIPGVLKNTLDWASRPPGQSDLVEKPFALMGATPAGFGTVQCQAILRHVLAHAQAYVLPAQRVLVSHAYEHFDAEGHLVDDSIREELAALVAALVAWAERLRAGQAALLAR
jgi:chromate reductase, NAD(P)H dehydrogenase (quinone)